jgi:hypothetical protein
MMHNFVGLCYDGIQKKEKEKEKQTELLSTSSTMSGKVSKKENFKKSFYILSTYLELI